MRILLSFLILVSFALGHRAIGQTTISIPIHASSDDAEEQGLNGNSPGTMDLTSSDIELLQDGGDGDQFVGLRFSNLDVPKGALITQAFIQFAVDETVNTAGTVYFQVEDSGNPGTFADVVNNISSRPRLADTISWTNIPEWITAGDATEEQRSPNLARLVQKIIDRGDWVTGQSISFILTGTGKRTAEAYDGDQALVAQLVVTYVEAFSKTFSIAASSDDAESDVAGGAPDLTSSDLELTSDGSSVQVISLRFADLDIPQGSVIENAFIQFTVDETNSGGQVDVLLVAENTGNSAEIAAATNPVARNYGDSSVLWSSLPDWSTLDVAGAEQLTPDIAKLIQSVVDRTDWQSGNALMISMVDPFVLGIPGFSGNTSKRVAQTYDKSPAAAARLMVTYFAPNAYQVGDFPVEAGSSWTFDDSGIDRSQQNWTAPNFDDSGWKFGDAILGYANNNESTTLDFGGDAAAKHPTYYLRHTFNVDNAARFDSLVFNVLRDDGVVVYVNGTEAFRMNMPSGPVGFATLAEAAVGGDDETTYFRKMTANLLRDGINVIAVEVHQNSPSSSDLSFDMSVGFRLPPLQAASFPLPKESSWHYLDSGVSLDSVMWQDTSFSRVDNAWEQGPGILGYGDPVNTEVSFGPDPNNKYTTYYFRREIDIDLTTLPDSIELGLLRDDGAIVYINGREVRRDNLPAGPINYLTTAVETIAGSDETNYYTSTLYPSDFREGINTIAVQLHNRDLFSSDLAFDLYLKEAPIVNPPMLGCANGNDEHIACFTSIVPSSQTSNLLIPTSSHRFQMIFKQGSAYTIGGGTVPGNHDFTGYVGKDSSSVRGYLSINHETSPGGVSMLGMHFDSTTNLWVIDSSQAVDFYNIDLVTTVRNCSGGLTPWGTVITAEENLNNDDANGDGYTDVGWLIEIDPVTAKVPDYGTGKQQKLWATGRMSHENAVVLEDEVTLFTGEDGGSSAVFKFIADQARDLTRGTLYALKLDGPLVNGEPSTTTGTWIQIPNTTPQDRNSTRALAIALGATNFNGVEDIEVDPLSGRIYFTAKGLGRTFRFVNDNATTAITGFETFVGGKSYTLNTEAGVFTEPWGGGNDNLTFDDQGNLWVLQDGGRNYIWVVRPDHTQESPRVELFMSAPIGSEPTGLTFSPDYRFGFLSIQHPSSTVEPQRDASGNEVTLDRSATIVISRTTELGAQPPVARFSSNTQQVEIGESITFTDLSRNRPSTRQWVFDGGVPAVSSDSITTVRYNGLGTYAVRLTVANGVGQDIAIDSQYVTVVMTSDLDELGAERALSVFPNPSTGRVSVTIELNAGDTVGMDLYDLQGRHIQQLVSGKGATGHNVYSLNLNDYFSAPQLVVLRVEVNGKSSVERIMFQP